MNEINGKMPDAYARMNGSPKYDSIKGTVYLYGTYGGTVLIAEIYGIPEDLEKMTGGFFGFHIHEGGSCTGNATDPFADTGAHYNPENVEHPRHAGDLPPLMTKDGIAWMAVYTGRIYPEDVVGKTVVVHGMPDDFKTQPSGNSGEKIACGEIVFWDGNFR